jgi:hypothetical protein
MRRLALMLIGMMTAQTAAPEGFISPTSAAETR